MPWTKTGNVAMYGQADWSGYKKTVANCSPEQARRIAMLDPAISFFFFCRGAMVLTNPAWPAPRTFNPGDAVFFSGEPWWGSAPQCDAYQKDGVSVAYVGSLGGADPGSPLIAGKSATGQGLNAVDIVCLFAANLNQTLTGDYIRLAPKVPVPSGGTLAVAHKDYLKVFQASVAALRAQGIAVLLSFLNNHDDAGWSQFDPTSAAGQADAQRFAHQLQVVTDTYGFDGIDIDDEYSNGQAYDDSLPMVTEMMRALMPDLIISKAIYMDSGPFSGSYQGTTLAQNLTYGWNMTYGESPDQLLPAYVQAGMSPSALMMGYSAAYPPFSGDPKGEVAWLKTNGYAGVMSYPFENPADQVQLGSLIDDWMGPGNWNKHP